jgi:hypothetical protein
MRPSDALSVRQQEYDRALQSGNRDAIAEASINLSRAETQVVKENSANIISTDRSFDQFDSALKGYFSPGILPNFLKSSTQKADSDAYEKLRNTAGRAIYSGDSEQVLQSQQFTELLSSLPQSTRNEWNTNNTLNALSDSNGIGQLLSALMELIEATKDNGRINLTVEN